MKAYINIVLCAVTASLLLISCTLNVSMAHTQGMATDTIDDNQSTDPTVSPTVTVPISAIPSLK